jgi:streptogramin lyase
VANSGKGSVTNLSANGGTAEDYFGNGDFDTPIDVAIDSGGHVWVADDGDPGVIELDNTGTETGYFTPPGAGFDLPESVAIDASGNVWVANNAGGSVAEFIGAAGPVLTPLEACLTQVTPNTVCKP